MQLHLAEAEPLVGVKLARTLEAVAEQAKMTSRPFLECGARSRSLARDAARDAAPGSRWRDRPSLFQSADLRCRPAGIRDLRSRTRRQPPEPCLRPGLVVALAIPLVLAMTFVLKEFLECFPTVTPQMAVQMLEHSDSTQSSTPQRENLVRRVRPVSANGRTRRWRAEAETVSHRRPRSTKCCQRTTVEQHSRWLGSGSRTASCFRSPSRISISSSPAIRICAISRS